MEADALPIELSVPLYNERSLEPAILQDLLSKGVIIEQLARRNFVKQSLRERRTKYFNVAFLIFLLTCVQLPKFAHRRKSVDLRCDTKAWTDEVFAQLGKCPAAKPESGKPSSARKAAGFLGSR